MLHERNAIHRAVLFAAAVICYLPCLFLGFAFDDKPRLLENPGIRSLSNFNYFFSQPSWPGDLYRPLEAVYFALIYTAFEYQPLPYHLLSLLLHSACTVLSYQLLLRLFSSQVAFVGALLFAVHAVHVEAIANVSYVSELSASCFMLASLLVAISARSFLQHCVVFTLTLCALGSKESAVSLLVLTPLTLLFLNNRNYKQTLRTTAVVLAATMLYLAWRMHLFGSPFATQSVLPYDNVLVTLTQPALALNGVVLLGKYLNLFLLPYPLSAVYSYAKITPLTWPLSPTAHSHILLLLLFFGATVYLAWHKQRIVYGSLFFLAAIALTANIAFPIGTPFAERLLYLPSVGLCLLLAGALEAVKHRALQRALLAGLVFLHIVIAISEIPYWSNDYTRFKREVEISPQSAVAHINFGYQLFIRGEIQAAERHYHQALKIHPQNTAAVRGLAILHHSQADYSKAEIWLRRMISMEPRNDFGWGLFADTLYKLGRYELAQEAAHRALAINPEQSHALEILGQMPK